MQLVISAVPGTGKSTICKEAEKYGLKHCHVGKDGYTRDIQLDVPHSDKVLIPVFDSDSSLFDKEHFPGNYIEHIKSVLRDYKDVVIMVSSHENVREALREAGINYNLAYPERGLKGLYLERYVDRGSPEAFVNMMDDKWNEFIDSCEADPSTSKLILSEGEYLVDKVSETLLQVAAQPTADLVADIPAEPVTTAPAVESVSEAAEEAVQAVTQGTEPVNLLKDVFAQVLAPKPGHAVENAVETAVETAAEAIVAEVAGEAVATDPAVQEAIHQAKETVGDTVAEVVGETVQDPVSSSVVPEVAAQVAGQEENGGDTPAQVAAEKLAEAEEAVIAQEEPDHSIAEQVETKEDIANDNQDIVDGTVPSVTGAEGRDAADLINNNNVAQAVAGQEGLVNADGTAVVVEVPATPETPAEPDLVAVAVAEPTEAPIVAVVETNGDVTPATEVAAPAPEGTVAVVAEDTVDSVAAVVTADGEQVAAVQVEEPAPSQVDGAESAFDPAPAPAAAPVEVEVEADVAIVATNAEAAEAAIVAQAEVAAEAAASPEAPIEAAPVADEPEAIPAEPVVAVVAAEEQAPVIVAEVAEESAPVEVAVPTDAVVEVVESPFGRADLIQAKYDMRNDIDVLDAVVTRCNEADEVAGVEGLEDGSDMLISAAVHIKGAYGVEVMPTMAGMESFLDTLKTAFDKVGEALKGKSTADASKIIKKALSEAADAAEVYTSADWNEKNKSKNVGKAKVSAPEFLDTVNSAEDVKTVLDLVLKRATDAFDKHDKVEHSRIVEGIKVFNSLKGKGKEAAAEEGVKLLSDAIGSIPAPSADGVSDSGLGDVKLASKAVEIPVLTEDGIKAVAGLMKEVVEVMNHMNEACDVTIQTALTEDELYKSEFFDALPVSGKEFATLRDAVVIDAQGEQTDAIGKAYVKVGLAVAKFLEDWILASVKEPTAE